MKFPTEWEKKVIFQSTKQKNINDNLTFRVYSHSLPEGISHYLPMKNHHFPMVVLWFSYGFHGTLLIYIYICICMVSCVYIRMYLYMYLYVSVCICMYLYIYITIYIYSIHIIVCELVCV